MGVQDLTPQLRTRLGRAERVVAWFVIIALVLLLGGFAYYFYVTAARKGWFIPHVPYYTYVMDATGLNEGDKVKLMGFDVGEITRITATPAADYWYIVNSYNVYVQFRIRAPFYGYIWSDSRVRIETGDLLGSRVLEVTKGMTGEVSVIEENGHPLRILNDKADDLNDYVLLSEHEHGYWLRSLESPALTVRFDRIADQLEAALPSFFAMTNQIQAVLTNASLLTAELKQTVTEARPIAANLAESTASLTNGPGAAGRWLLGTETMRQIESLLGAAEATAGSAEEALDAARTNLVTVASNLNTTISHLAGITESFKEQVRTNDSILGRISEAVLHADELMQGMKRHWLLRSAFKEEGEERGSRGTDEGGRRDPVGLPARGGREW